MAHIDTLKYFEELTNAGDSELEAKAHVYALNNGISDLVTIDDLHKELETLESKLSVKIDATFGTIKTLGWGITVIVAIPLFKIAFWP